MLISGKVEKSENKISGGGYPVSLLREIVATSVAAGTLKGVTAAEAALTHRFPVDRLGNVRIDEKTGMPRNPTATAFYRSVAKQVHAHAVDLVLAETIGEGEALSEEEKAAREKFIQDRDAAVPLLNRQEMEKAEKAMVRPSPATVPVPATNGNVPVPVA